VREAESAESALQAVQESHFDVMLSDIAMPAMDGYDLMREIRRRGISIVGIALTAFTGPKTATRALRAGFTQLGKPISTADLLQTIADAVHERKGLRSLTEQPARPEFRPRDARTLQREQSGPG
jgi:CheY-like chemotaxis protein